MEFNREQDLPDEDFEKWWAEIEELSKIADQSNNLLKESDVPKFSTIEEARAYYSSIPFSEWRKEIREKYGL